jgi:hypothetical protein
MTREEAIKVLAILKAAYPNSYRGMTKEEAHGTVAVWAAQFANMPASVVMIAINKIISKNTFPPSINEVKDEIRGLYWETWHALDLHKRGLVPLDEKTVAALEEIDRIVAPMQSRMSNAPTLTELLESYGGYLNEGADDTRLLK